MKVRLSFVSSNPLNRSRVSDDPSNSDEYTQRQIVKLRYLRLTVRARIKKRAVACETGASLASRSRDMDFAKCSMMKVWLVDTGCGYDIVSKREVGLTKRFVHKAKNTITFHTANGLTVTENVANIYVHELDENITPFILNNTPPVLTVGYRCVETGYTIIWLHEQSPFFIRPDGMIIHLVVEKALTYYRANSAADLASQRGL